MQLDTDTRSMGDFKNDITWDALDILHNEALNTVKKGIELANTLITENTDIMVESGVDVNALKGIVLSFKDIQKDIATNKLNHNDRTGSINPNNFKDYSEYLEIASKYQSLIEYTATLISSSYMDVLNTVAISGKSLTAAKAYTGLKHEVPSETKMESKPNA